MEGFEIIITISGLPGSGTTTVGKLLSNYYVIEMISAGDVFRGLAKKHGMSLAQFGEFAESNPSVDQMIDERQKELALSRDNIILEGRLAGHMAPDALKIWLKAPMEERVSRIVSREGSCFDVRLQETEAREVSEALRYKEVHGIDINDLSVYDIVIDSSRWDQFTILEILKNAIDAVGGFEY